MKDNVNIVLSAMTVFLLIVAIWRIEMVEHVGSGQIVRTGEVETERWMDESLDSWRDRHLEAIREFKGSDQ